ncbi:MULTISPECIES: hypothetical protein [unclassified Acinetobacter]|uniref:hypothetical protein n=1 Tax=unclassified Acinetobacter TaxID=196816 RepID=UPI0022AC80E7|nr:MULTISPECIES: hypothetical protein [unclassified Acinetobacter]WAU72979.1 hypothetical protein O1450_12920 [Acinetobacter sp. TR11]WAU76072.1 hypothetical protein O1449_12430 [Acinetobacter sp. TR3]
MNQSCNDGRNITEAILQVHVCIATLKQHKTKQVTKEAKKVLTVIRKNLNWENSPELSQKVHLLQGMLYKAV